jgi:hypothetical protein
MNARDIEDELRFDEHTEGGDNRALQWFLRRLVPLIGRQARYAGLELEATQTGMGDSRELLTQSGQTQAISQGAPLTEGFVYTATFDVIPPTDDEGNMVPFAAEAQIRFSEKGNTIQRVISIVQGVSISLPGRVIEIRITDTTPSTLPPGGESPIPTPGAGSPYVVTVVIERAPRASGQPPTLYGGIVPLSGGGTAVVAIPIGVGAKSLVIGWAGNPVPAPLLVSFTTAAGGAFAQYIVSADLEGVPLPVPPGATEVLIENTDATNPGNATITWIIDG